MAAAFLRQDFLQGGIQAIYTPNPFDDEKGNLTPSLTSMITFRHHIFLPVRELSAFLNADSTQAWKYHCMNMELDLVQSR